MGKILLEIGSRKITEEEFVNVFFNLLVGYLLFDQKDLKKLSKDEVVKLAKIFFDLTLDEVISRNSIIELMKLRSKELPKIESTEEGEEMQQVIKEKLELAGIETPLVSLLTPQLLQNAIEEQYFISHMIEEFLINEGTLDYDNLKRYYDDTFLGFPLLSFLFISLPLKIRKEIVEKIKKEMLETEPKQMEKIYLKDPEKVVYYYENIDVFDYFTSEEEFESQKMFKLMDILSVIGVDPDNLKLDDNIKKGEIISVSTKERQNFYLFDKIEYNKPEFNEKIHEYIKHSLFESLYDEVYFKIYNEAMDKVKVKYYEDNLRPLEKMISKVSMSWFENFEKIL